MYSSLKQEPSTDDKYKHAQNVYEQLKCKACKDYHMTYLKCDVLRLADVFEKTARISAFKTTSWTPQIV